MIGTFGLAALIALAINGAFDGEIVMATVSDLPSTGGIGTAFGAVIGSALIEVIRNSLGLLGISAFWQGTFVGTFIIIAVALDRIRTFRFRT
jgi:ribose transport system permease protein